MRLRDRVYQLLLRHWSQRMAARGLAALRAQGHISEEPHWLGTPYLEIAGDVRIGHNFRLASLPVQSHLVVHAGAALHIGDNVAIGFGSGVAVHTRVSIGDDTICGPYVMILDSDYHVAGQPDAPAIPEPITIGKRVRIGSGVTVLRGAQIEDDVSIAPGSVVSGLVPRGASVSGVPARDLSLPLQAASGVDVSAGVLAIAQRTFRLATLPQPSDGPDQLPRWDSLGALSLWLALEDSFEINLHVDDAVHVRALSDVVTLVQRALERRERVVPLWTAVVAPATSAVG